ncbi:hypothetical protein [Thermosulfurimonas dismutans]|nr:hypothetical protein [Thermosulfurimonas dismutans]
MVAKTFRLAFIGLLCWLWPFLSIGAPTEKTGLSEILSAFREEIAQARISLNFEILDSSYAKFDFLGGFADGRYQLKAYRITPLKDGVYRLDLRFEKKKGLLTYRQKVFFYFWHHQNRIVFLTPKGKKKFLLPEEEIRLEKTSVGYRIIKTYPEIVIKLPTEAGKVYLKVRPAK